MYIALEARLHRRRPNTVEAGTTADSFESALATLGNRRRSADLAARVIRATVELPPGRATEWLAAGSTKPRELATALVERIEADPECFDALASAGGRRRPAPGALAVLATELAPDTARALAALHLLALGKRPATPAATAWAAQLLLRTPHATGAAISGNRWPGPWMQRRAPAPALAGTALRLVRYRLRRNTWPSPDASL